jgi:uncharacterized membrane protein
MKSLAQLGRYFFAIPFAVFGRQYFLYGHYAGRLSRVPPWAPGGAAAAYRIGAFLVIPAISLLANSNARLFATLLGLAVEPLSLSGAASVLAGRSPSAAATASWNSFIDKLARLGRYLFSLPLLTGVAFLGAGLGITSGIAARLACFFLGVMFFLWTVLLHAPRVVTHLNNGDECSSAFVALAMAGASFLLLPFSERT